TDPGKNLAHIRPYAEVSQGLIWVKFGSILVLEMSRITDDIYADPKSKHSFWNAKKYWACNLFQTACGVDMNRRIP
ncbi:MAG: hypothetical protein ACKVKG_15815, partial [Alphaproteobacteria bacterium]